MSISGKTSEERALERRLAASNMAVISAYEALYAPKGSSGLPPGMVESIYKAIMGCDYFAPPKKVIQVAKAAALGWLVEHMEQSPKSSTDTSPFGVLRLADGESDKKDTGPGLKLVK